MNRLKSVMILLLIVASFPSWGQQEFFQRLADSTLTLIYDRVTYDPSYFSIDYPYGDIPGGKGVCTDVIIRAYRKMGIDLQKEVHEDMKVKFNQYPNIWGLTSTDKNIDHRRVPNLMKFFENNGEVRPITESAEDYMPGDVVCWDLGGGTTHIGIIVRKKSMDRQRYLVVHNIGAGQVIQDCLFDYKIIGHYRYK